MMDAQMKGLKNSRTLAISTKSKYVLYGKELREKVFWLLLIIRVSGDKNIT